MDFSLKNYIVDYLNKNKDNFQTLSNADIARKLIAEDSYIRQNYSNRPDTLRRLISKIRSSSEENVNFSTDKEPKELKTPYKVIGNKHYFFPIKGEFSLPNEVVDELFYSYSEHGLDLSSTEMILKYNLQPWQWHAIKSALRLYKKSHIFSPNTVENVNSDELQSIIKDKMDERVNTVAFRVEQEYQKSILRKYKDIINRDSLRDLEIKTIINELADLLPEVKINRVECQNNDSYREINVIIADIHFGAKNDNKNHLLPKYSIELLQEQFDKIIRLVNAQNADNVNIFLGGDLIDSFSGKNKSDTFKGIHEGIYGAKLVKECFEFLLNFISNINNVSKVIGVSGNHDRAASLSSEESEGFIAEIIFEFLKLSLKSNQEIEVIFDTRLENLLIDDIAYILTHGHEKLTNINASNLVLRYGSQEHFNILLSGHLHSRFIKEDTERFRKIVCPSIYPGNDWAVGQGFSTQPGFLIIENNGYGKPIVHDYSL